MATQQTRIMAFERGRLLPREDALAIEEPLEIVLASGPRASRKVEVYGITMRTPGHDTELVAGLLFAEGVVSERDEIEGLISCGDTGNRLRVELSPQWKSPPQSTSPRNISSACGVCGRQTIDDLLQRIGPLSNQSINLNAQTIITLPDQLRKVQGDFNQTGGLHACGIFSIEGKLIDAREDVGRHNAVDKIIGQQFLNDTLPLQESLLVVSGRASFELVQKATRAGLSALIAVGAPSSLAVELATRTNLILIGFTREGRFNVYAGMERLKVEDI